jgi:hypothetical protein
LTGRWQNPHNIEIDQRFQAMRPGKRFSHNGNRYYERRSNRADKGRLLWKWNLYGQWGRVLANTGIQCIPSAHSVPQDVRLSPVSTTIWLIAEVYYEKETTEPNPLIWNGGME